MTAFDAQASNNAHAAQRAMENEPAHSFHENPVSRTDLERQLIETTFPQVALGENALRFTSDEDPSLSALESRHIPTSTRRLSSVFPSQLPSSPT